MEEIPLPLAPGEVLAGKYRILRVLGAGGMGIVLAAEHIKLHQMVAIKLVRPGVIDGTIAVERFLREARAAVNLRSEHVARVFDVGTLEDGSPYMVMEYLEGADLACVLFRDGPLSVEDVATYVIQACEALAEAHAAGIVHRDLKPSNLFLARAVDGTPLVKVLDFGVSKVASTRGTQGLTRTAAVMGSPLYMAPEQMQSARSATARSDIWALGVVAYELLTKHLPFEAESMPELCLKVVNAPPVPPRVHRPDVPVAVEAIILRCLDKDPARRFRDAGELAAALAPFAQPNAQAVAIRARLIVTGLRPTDSDSAQRMPQVMHAPSDGGVSSTRPPVPRAARKGIALATFGAVALVLVGALAFFARGQREPGTSVPTASVTLQSAPTIIDTPHVAPHASAPAPVASSAAPAASSAPPTPRRPPPARAPAPPPPEDDIPALR